MPRIAIIGLGLIGASLGLALRKNLDASVTIVGSDWEPQHASRAKKLGAVDRTEWTAAAAAEGADIVIVATPIIAVRQVFENIAPVLSRGAIVTDTASVKGVVIEAADELLPAHVHFVGGHPMAGSDRSGPDSASETLFIDENGAGRPYCVVPSTKASEEAIRNIIGLAERIGARPIFIDAKEHDALVAGVSHMPLLLSVALFTMARNSPSWDDMAPLAGPAFREFTRLAKGSPELALDIFSSNREHLLHWLGRFEDEIGRYRALLEGEERQLHQALLRAQIERERFDQVEPKRPEPSSGTGIGDQFMSMMVGERLMQRARDISNLTKVNREEQKLDERELRREQTQQQD